MGNPQRCSPGANAATSAGRAAGLKWGRSSKEPKKHFVPDAISPVGWSQAPATPVQAAAAQGAGFGQSAEHVALLRALLRASQRP